VWLAVAEGQNQAIGVCVLKDAFFDIVYTSDPDSIISSPTPRAALDIGVEVTPEEADNCDAVLAGEFIAHA